MRIPKEVFKNTKNSSYWLDTVTLPVLEKIPDGISVDTLVIGAGFSGTIIAHHLARKKKDVVLLEQKLGVGASFNTGGIIVPGVALYPKDSVGMEGFNEVRQMYNASIRGISELEKLVEAEKIDCDLQMGGAILALVKNYHKGLIETDVLLRKKFGDKAEMLDYDELQKYIRCEEYWGAGHYSNGGIINPAKFVVGLQERIIKKGGKVFQGKAKAFRKRRYGEIIVDIIRDDNTKTQVSCNNIVIASNYFVDTENDELGYLRNNVIPVQCYALTTEPLTEQEIRDIGWKEGMSITDSVPDFHYARMTIDNRILIGAHTTCLDIGEVPDKKTQQKIYESIYRELVRLHPIFKAKNGKETWKKVSHAWYGNIAMTDEFLPFYGKEQGNNIYYASGYNGHGLVLSTVLGKAVAEMIAGESASNKDAEIFKETPPKNPGRIWPWYVKWSKAAEFASTNYFGFKGYEAITRMGLRREMNGF